MFHYSQVAANGRSTMTGPLEDTTVQFKLHSDVSHIINLLHIISIMPVLKTITHFFLYGNIKNLSKSGYIPSRYGKQVATENKPNKQL